MRIRFLLRTVATLMTIAGLSASPLAAQDSAVRREQERVEVLRRISPSVVCVMASSGEGGGSGVLISPDGFAISNYHVTSGSGNFMKCGLNDGHAYDAVIVGIDPTGDVALVQLLGRTDFPAATPGNSDQVQAGDEVMALGNPFLLASDFSPTVTYGIVSGVRRYQYPANTFLEYTDCIQIDASINPGNSGGPLFDVKGRWIGINGRASFEKRGRVNSGAAYAISVNQVLRFIDHLKCGLIVDHGQADFTVETSDEGEIIVSQVSELSEAWRRGLRQRAQLVSFAGRTMTSANDFQNILGTFPEGSRVPLVWRDREGLHQATIRLSPLHGFRKAPALPEERQQPHRDGEDPEDAEKNPAEMEQEELPAEITALFVEKDGFCNSYFNDLRRKQLLEPFIKAIGDPSALAGTWQVSLRVSIRNQEAEGELVSAPDSVAMKLGADVWLQKLETPDAKEEPEAFPGLLIAVGQIRRFLSQSEGAFSEVVAAGETLHLPTQKTWKVLLTRDGIRTGRWYFAEGQPFPAGLDLEFAAGVDEIRLVFEDWSVSGGTAFPKRIGVIQPGDEQIQWITVTAITTKTEASR